MSFTDECHMKIKPQEQFKLFITLEFYLVKTWLRADGSLG